MPSGPPPASSWAAPPEFYLDENAVTRTVRRLLVGLGYRCHTPPEVFGTRVESLGAEDTEWLGRIARSGWVAARVLPSAHTNPIWVTVAGEPARPSRRSAKWCLAAVDRCWLQKRDQIKDSEREAAKAAYDNARDVYQRLLTEGVDE